MPEYKLRYPHDQRKQWAYENACDCILWGFRHDRLEIVWIKSFTTLQSLVEGSAGRRKSRNDIRRNRKWQNMR